jgi:NADP-dependent 3-hydroxy acid dehydrogenase YdfG
MHSVFSRLTSSDFFLPNAARHEEKGLAACEQLKKEGLHAPKFYQLDITDRQQIMEFRQHLQKTYGGIDILVNNASVPHKVEIFIYYSPTAID